MPQLDWNVILTGLLYAALTGVFNLIFAHKSQINAWAEAHPKLAALLKVTRAIGLDPQHLWAALALFVKGRLPRVQTEPPSERDVPVKIGPLLVLLLAGLVMTQQGCTREQAIQQINDPCSKVSYMTILAGCEARVRSECVIGDKACKVYVECTRALEAWRVCETGGAQ